jgi:GH25 family lysozyme M1 (1,4-beta-N-acetylmuramidase)
MNINKTCSMGLAVLLVTSLFKGTPAFANLNGIDVSHYQNTINWDAVKTAESFAIAKTSEGLNIVDGYFTGNKAGMLRVGINRGYYHFGHPDYGNSPIAEADFFLETVGGLYPNDVLVLDYEVAYSDPVNWCLAFLQRVYLRTGIVPLLYINRSTSQNYNWSAVINAGYDIWLADPDNNPDPNSPPTQWGFNAMKQYWTGGSVSGITGNVDLDIWNGDSFGTDPAGPGASWMNANRLDVIERGYMNKVQLRTWTSGGDWGGLTDLSGPNSTYNTPAIVSRADGIQDVFICGVDNALWHRHFENNAWAAWESLGGSMYSGPSATSMNSSNIVVVVRGINSDVWFKTWNSGVWSDWTLLSSGNSTFDTPAVCSRTNGILDVFIRGAFDNHLWHRHFEAITWAAWEDFGGYVTSGVSACSRNPDNITVLHRGDNYDVKYAAWNSGIWSSGSLGPSTASMPSVCALKPNRVDYFIRGIDQGLYQKVYQGTWTGYIYLGSYY